MTTLDSSFLIGSFIFMHGTRTTITFWMGLKFGKIQPRIYELAVLERLENSPWT